MHMRTIVSNRTRIVRAAIGVAAVAAAVIIPAGTASADPSVPDNAVATGPRAAYLPPGVVRLRDSQPCPEYLLCLYRDYGNSGPAYGIEPRHGVNLRHLPMPGGVHGNTAADEVSSWVNNTPFPVLLVDEDEDVVRPLHPRQSLQEPAEFNDTVDLVIVA